MAGVSKPGCPEHLGPPSPAQQPPRHLIEAAVRQAGVLLVLRSHVGGCEAVAFPIDIFPKAQGCHLRAQGTSQYRYRFVWTFRQFEPQPVLLLVNTPENLLWGANYKHH